MRTPDFWNCPTITCISPAPRSGSESGTTRSSPSNPAATGSDPARRANRSSAALHYGGRLVRLQSRPQPRQPVRTPAKNTIFGSRMPEDPAPGSTGWGRTPLSPASLRSAAAISVRSASAAAQAAALFQAPHGDRRQLPVQLCLGPDAREQLPDDAPRQPLSCRNDPVSAAMRNPVARRSDREKSPFVSGRSAATFSLSPDMAGSVTGSRAAGP